MTQDKCYFPTIYVRFIRNERKYGFLLVFILASFQEQSKNDEFTIRLNVITTIISVFD